jgi:hypothetical protein
LSDLPVINVNLHTGRAYASKIAELIRIGKQSAKMNEEQIEEVDKHFQKIKQAIIGARDINVDDTGSIKLRYHKDDKHSLSILQTDKDALA